MQFESAPERARTNFVKHGVFFSIAERVWDDPLHVLVFDRYEDGEMRWHAIGVVASVMVLVVVHSYPDASEEDRVRIIGAGRTTPRERRRYAQEGP